MRKQITPPKLSWSTMRVGDLPFIYPLSFYLRALLPRRLGGRPIYESVARCEHYDQEIVFYYLHSLASEAWVRGDEAASKRIDLLAAQARERWESAVAAMGV